MAYDHQYHWEALARKDLDWSVTDSRLYNEAFTGCARAIARCAVCLQGDHAANQCPRNPNRPMFGWLPDMAYWPHQYQFAALQPASTSCSTPTAHAPSQEVSRRFNNGHCTKQGRRYAHSCWGCGGPHALINCVQRNGSLVTGQSRSLPRSTASHTQQARLCY